MLTPKHRSPLRMQWQTFWIGIMVGLLLWGLALLLLYTLAHAADEGLPENTPNLYDPAVVASYSMVHRTMLSPHLQSTILTDSAGYVVETKEPLSYTIGYLTDTRKGRIVVIVQTFLRLHSNLRNVRAWVGVDWVAGKPAQGQWDCLTNDRISHPMTVDETKVVLDGIYGKIHEWVQRDAR